MNLTDLNQEIEDQFPALSRGLAAGYVGGIYHAGETVTHAAGIANLNTGAPMTTDTRWVLGSITKVLVASMILRLVDQGRIDLDRRVVDYLPEFRLKVDGMAEAILVRHLLDHTNGIDADTLYPPREFGPRAVQSYVEALGSTGLLFEPGTFTHYSNPGYALAGRILERLEGVTFNEAIERDLYGPLGMTESCTSAEQAILHRTAVGAHYDAAAGGLKATSMFMLPVASAATGTTPIVTAADLLRFGRMHLAGGKAENGATYLSADSTARMQKVSFDLGVPNSAPTGLGWRRVPIAGTTALFHSGGSPGGSSTLSVFPEHELIITGFASGPGGLLVHDGVLALVLKALLGRDVEAPFARGAPPRDLSAFAGEYASFQSSMSITAAGETLHCQPRSHPIDEDHRRVALGYLGTLATPAFSLEPLNETLFKPAGAPDELFHGIMGRQALTSFHRPDAGGRYGFRHSGWRAMPRVG